MLMHVKVIMEFGTVILNVLAVNQMLMKLLNAKVGKESGITQHVDVNVLAQLQHFLLLIIHANAALLLLQIVLLLLFLIVLVLTLMIAVCVLQLLLVMMEL